jgi:hypothetical protein
VNGATAGQAALVARWRGLAEELNDGPYDAGNQAESETLRECARQLDELPAQEPRAAQADDAKAAPKLGELTVAICDIPGHAPHAARITVDYGLQVTSFCLPPQHAAFLGDALGATQVRLARADRDAVRERMLALAARWERTAADDQAASAALGQVRGAAAAAVVAVCAAELRKALDI